MVIYLSKIPVSPLTFKDYVILFGAIGYLILLLFLTFNFAFLQTNICYNVRPLNNTLNNSVYLQNITQKYYNYTDGFYIVKIINNSIIDSSKLFYENKSN